jgi:hypothetical protein
MSYIFEVITVILSVSNVILWRQYRDRKLAFLAILGIIPLIAFFLHILGKTYFGISPLVSFILFFGFFGSMCWYSWRKFGDTTSMVALLLSLFGAAAVAYSLLVSSA